jgi:formate-dependent phosphoribosylglycinamide formyltransferase (GAR transformylase)
MSKKVMIMSAALEGRLMTAVEAAKKAGIKTVACIRKEDDINLVNADSCYAVDNEDVDTLLAIAKKEKIDGILGMWDKCVLPAAIIAKDLGLIGNSPDSVRCLLEKDSFRKLQRKAGVYTPEFFETDSTVDLKEKCSKLKFPIIMKPVLCSSSFGQTVLYDDNDIINAFEKASANSRNGYVCIEEFVEQDSLKVLEADIVMVGDDILWDGLRWCYRFPEAPLRPVLDT